MTQDAADGGAQDLLAARRHCSLQARLALLLGFLQSPFSFIFAVLLTAAVSAAAVLQRWQDKVECSRAGTFLRSSPSLVVVTNSSDAERTAACGRSWLTGCNTVHTAHKRVRQALLIRYFKIAVQSRTGASQTVCNLLNLDQKLESKLMVIVRLFTVSHISWAG